MELMPKHKKGGVVSNTIYGVGGLIIGTIVILVIVQTITGANLLTAGTTEASAVTGMKGNFTSGLDNVSSKIPTILLIVAVVFLFGALLLLVQLARKGGMGIGGGSSL